MIMAVKGLLNAYSHPTEGQAQDYLSGNPCRCATYKEVLAGGSGLGKRLVEIMVFETSLSVYREYMDPYITSRFHFNNLRNLSEITVELLEFNARHRS
jgi:hypothetical protein